MGPTSDDVVRELTARLTEVTARLDAIEGRTAVHDRRGRPDGTDAVSRRQLLTKLGAAAGVGIAGAMVINQSPAAAVGTFQTDTTNNATGETILNSSGDVNSALQVNENGAASGNRYGVDATTVNGVAGVHAVKGSTSGQTVPAAGVIGDSNQGAGVVGATAQSNSAGVIGLSPSGGRGGVFGTLGSAAALVERGGVVGSSDTGHGVAGVTSAATRAGTRGVWGAAAASTDLPAGVLGTSTTKTGVHGASTSADGVAGVSSTGSGVSGTSPATGVLGTTTGGAAKSGVQGLNGVSATSVPEGAGVLGAGDSAIGVAGTSISAAGSQGTSTNGAGVRAASTNASGLVASGRTQLTLVPGPTINPIAGSYQRGELFLGSNADLLLAKTGGNPATFLRVGYNALPLPFRLFDTRSSGPLFGPDERRAFNIAGTGTPPSNVPAGDVVHAAVLNVTVLSGTANSFLTLLPHDAPGGPPTYSNVNWQPGQVQANQATVRIVGGQFDVYNAHGNVHVIVDVIGFYS